MSLPDRSLPSSSKNRSALSPPALPAPHHPAASVVGDQRDVAVMTPPGDLVDPDLEQAVQPAGVDVGVHDPGADRPNRSPGHPEQPADRGPVHLGGAEGHQVLEVAREPRPRAGERHSLGHYAVHRAPKTAQACGDDQRPPPQVEVPPAGVDVPGVVAKGRGVAAVRAVKEPAAKRHGDDHGVGAERNLADARTLQGQQVVQCCGDAHGMTSGSSASQLEPYGSDLCASRVWLVDRWIAVRDLGVHAGRDAGASTFMSGEGRIHGKTPLVSPRTWSSSVSQWGLSVPSYLGGIKLDPTHSQHAFS